MTNRKNYNSILFLTVYLGLVLVGGSSHVFAHAASNALFELRNEIEFKEDLENKPDENDLISEPIIGIIKDLEIFSKVKIFNWDEKTSFIVEDLSFCKSDNTPSFLGSHSNNTSFDISSIIADHNVQIGRNLNKLRTNYKLGDFYSDYPEGISFNLLTENKSLSLEIKIKIKDKKTTQSFFDSLKLNISRKKFSSRNSKQSLIHDNTAISSENNQIFIVTRLPRAAIDSLLK